LRNGPGDIATEGYVDTTVFEAVNPIMEIADAGQIVVEGLTNTTEGLTNTTEGIQKNIIALSTYKSFMMTYVGSSTNLVLGDNAPFEVDVDGGIDPFNLISLDPISGVVTLATGYIYKISAIITNSTIGGTAFTSGFRIFDLATDTVIGSFGGIANGAGASNSPAVAVVTALDTTQFAIRRSSYLPR